MARSSIVEKLDKFLSNHLPFLEECEVIYLMVELRKIIEYDKSDNTYPLIKFYCDWALHIIKSQNLGVIQEILDKIDKDVPINVKYIKNPYGIFSFLEMSELKNQITQMFKTCHLSNKLYDNDKFWLSFVDNLSKILSEQPIAIKSGPIQSITLQYVESGKSLLKIVFKDERGSWSIGGDMN